MAFRNIRPRPSKPKAVSEEPKVMFTVLKIMITTEEGEASQPRVSVRGVHPSEDQAYAAAITELIFELEQATGAVLPKVREIAKTATLPLKDRLRSLQACHVTEDESEEEERAEFAVKKAHVFPEDEKMSDMDALLAGPLIPCAFWDSSDDEEDYDPAAEEDDDEDDDDDDEDDDMDLVNEDDAIQGIEGSGTKQDE